MKFLRVCKVRCKHCGDILGREYASSSEHGGPLTMCTCGKIGFDPGPICWRVLGEMEDLETLFEVTDDGLPEEEE